MSKGYFKKKWKAVKLVHKYVLFSVFFLIIPVVAIILILFGQIIPLIQKEGVDSLRNKVFQIEENVNYKIRIYENILMQLALDPNFSSLLSTEYESLLNAVMALYNNDATLMTIESYFPIQTVIVYKNNSALPENGGNVLNMERAYNDVWYKNMILNENQRLHWFYDANGEDTSFINLSTFIYPYQKSENQEIIRFKIKTEEFFYDLKEISSSTNGDVFVIDNSGYFLFNNAYGQRGENMFEIEWLNLDFDDGNGWFSIKKDGEAKLIVYSANDLGWKTIAIVGENEVMSKAIILRNMSILISGIFVALTFILLTLFVAGMKNRINKISASMELVGTGNFGLLIDVEKNDELGEIENKFNMMSEKLNYTLQKLAKAESIIKTEQLQLLQAQINPHFLYNTLALVKSMGLEADSEEICDTVDLLSKFYRVSLNKGNEILTLQEELEYVKAYIAIYEKRFPGRVKVHYDVDETALDYKIMKTTLQPIVENALSHAFISTNGFGNLEVKITKGEENIEIEIRDDGIGIDKEKLRFLLTKPISNDKGFGLYNVNERIKRFFGEQYGLKIESEPGRGTAIYVLIPIN